MADCLDRNGYKVKVINLAEEMVFGGLRDVENYLLKLESAVYAIDLHWVVHAQGSLEIAKLCKKHHPNSLTILGGLTATCFDTEIVKNFWYVDVVVRGEAEEAMLKLTRAASEAKLPKIQNLTYRDPRGRIHRNPLSTPCDDLNDLNFTRLDLVTPRQLEVTVTPWLTIKRGASLPICRGCAFNCVSCGGSEYSYRKLFGRDKPAFRGPSQIADDLRQLEEHGIKDVFLFQDPRMGGRKYWRKLFEALRREKTSMKRLSFELFTPANQEYLTNLASIGTEVNLSISPPSQVLRRFVRHTGATMTIVHCSRPLSCACVQVYL